MRKLTIIDYLIKTLPESAWPHTIRSLRHNPGVWQALNDQEFLNLAINKIGGLPKLWMPLNLALISLMPEIELMDWNHHDLLELYPELKEKSEVYYQDYDKCTEGNLDLAQSGLLAIYYFQNPDLITETTPCLVCACVYPLIRNKIVFLSQLSYLQAADVLLTHSLATDETWDSLAYLVTSYPLPVRIKAMRHFALFWPDQIARMAANSVGGTSPDHFSSPILPENDEPAHNLISTVYQIDLYELTKKKNILHIKILEGLHIVEQLGSHLSFRLMKTLLLDGKHDQALQIWEKEISQYDIKMVADMILFLVDQGFGSLVNTWVDDEYGKILANLEDYECLLAAGVFYAYQEEKSLALSYIKTALESSWQTSPIRNSHHLIAARILTNLGEYALSFKAIEKALITNPNQYDALELLLDNRELTKEFGQAIEVAQIMVILFPGRLDIHHRLASNLKRNEQWVDALHEYEKIISKQDKPQTNDMHLLADCSNLADQPQQAASICQQLLLSDPEDVEAHRILGEAYLALGDSLKAQKQFEQAIHISPDSVRSWLGLAKIADQKNNIDECRDILLTGSQAIPDCPDIQFALGQVFIKQNALTKALSAFQSASVSIRNHKSKQDKQIYAGILESLGNTQLLLGHREEAYKTLEHAYGLFPNDFKIIQTFAKCLLEVKDTVNAKKLLAKLKAEAPENPSVQYDYAVACLSAGEEDLSSAEEALRVCIKVDPENVQAKVLLAETYESLHKYENAYEIYKEVYNTKIYTNPHWQIRLGLGMGRVALALQDPGTAIVVLKNMLIGNREDLQVLKYLSVAYQAAEIKDEAMAVAKAALSISPDDLDNLDWFIEQMINLGNVQEGIDVINRLLENTPQSPKLLSRLGQLYIHQKTFELATETFNKIKSLEKTSVDDLFVAAQNLLEIDQQGDAIACLDRAIKVAKITEENQHLPRLLFTKSLAQKEQGKMEDALSTLNEADLGAQKTPEIIDLRTRILFDLGEVNSSLEYLELSMENFPNDIGLRLLAISLYRHLGQSAKAMAQAEDILDFPAKGKFVDNNLAAAGVVADLFSSMLHTGLAKDLLEQNVKSESASTSSDLFPGYCLKGELSLQAGEEVAAADALTMATRIDANHPRVLVLRSLLSLRQGDDENAKSIFNQALKSINDYPYLCEQTHWTISGPPPQFNDAASTFTALSEAALILHEWSVAHNLLKMAMQITPTEPRPYFCYARANVLRAEFQRFCEQLNIVTHAPGESSTAEDAYKEFEEAILKSAQFIPPDLLSTQIMKDGGHEPKKLISAWLARGQAVFKPSYEHANAISKIDPSPEIVAAYLASLRLCGRHKLAIQTALNYQDGSDGKPVNGLIQAQIALTLMDDEPQLALLSIQNAIDDSLRQKNILVPPFYAILALVAKRIDDRNLEIEALRSALGSWSNEPRWFSQLAEILLTGNQDEFSQAIVYLKQASSLEPKNIEHAIKLANTYQKIGDIQDAVNTLELAVQDNTDQPGLWLALGQLYFSDHNNPQAIRCARNAISIDPNLVEAHLLLADISCVVGNPDVALNYTRKILGIQPNNPKGLLLKYKALKALGQKKEALAVLEKTIPLYSESITLHLERVDLISQTQGVEKALETIQLLSTDNPSEVKILIAKAEIIAKSGDLETGIRLIQEILGSKDFELKKPEIGQLNILLGRLLRMSGQLDQAIYHLTEAIRISPDNPDSYVELGRCYQDRRQYDLALQNFQDAIAIQPDCARNYYLAGMVLKETKDFEKAETMLTHASKLSPTDLNIHRQLGAVTAINIVTNRKDSSFVTI